MPNEHERTSPRDTQTVTSPLRPTVAPFAEALATLMSERGLSARSLAEQIGVHHTHVSVLLRGEKPPSVSLMRATSRALQLPPGYWAEERIQAVCDRVRTDPQLRDRLYRQLIANPAKGAKSRPRQS